ncbi:GNAT superfamily N-acetyltransferase [Psychromicrobium silvestre]|uniref:GNAT superfamily N-acetyltransferase n=1 Tax=Psychromicrobium silvestre TaxID=1645614 RepID=A0A7Y9LRV5_9MICC|nr:GNAT family N-acetyltransferase [Psychromicrobium silvestre]NYE94439.1 GNAT superfamily N-acetyltransferase [Psychromicrobium silvestre]
MHTHRDLLAVHDDQVRGSIEVRMPLTWTAQWDGPLLRVTTPAQGIAFAKDLEGLSVTELDLLIQRLRDYFSKRGEAVEWKTYGHDRPDLPARLRLAGFNPEETETVVIGNAAELATDAEPPHGVIIRETTARKDFDRIAYMESEVWGKDWSWLAEDLASRCETSPDDVAVLIAEADGQVVSAAWLVGLPGTEFGGLWGGSTLKQWRGKGIYRALVARRAQIAVSLRMKYLVVDASDASSPILQRLGFQKVTTTTPWVWSPRT